MTMPDWLRCLLGDHVWVHRVSRANGGSEWSECRSCGRTAGYRTGLCAFVCLGEMASLSGRTEGSDG